MYGGVVCTVCVCESNIMWDVTVQKTVGACKLKTNPKTESFTEIEKETKSCLTKSKSLLEGLVDRGVGVQGGGTIVHELGGVVRSDGAEVAAV